MTRKRKTYTNSMASSEYCQRRTSTSSYETRFLPITIKCEEVMEKHAEGEKNDNRQQGKNCRDDCDLVI
jgi:hypothetical protein